MTERQARILIYDRLVARDMLLIGRSLECCCTNALATTIGINRVHAHRLWAGDVRAAVSDLCAFGSAELWGTCIS